MINLIRIERYLGFSGKAVRELRPKFPAYVLSSIRKARLTFCPRGMSSVSMRQGGKKMIIWERVEKI